MADLEITLILGRAQACGLVVLVTAAEGHAGERAHASLGTHHNQTAAVRALLAGGVQTAKKSLSKNN